VLANAVTFMSAQLANQHIQTALETRDLIGQPKGSLMASWRRRPTSTDRPGARTTTLPSALGSTPQASAKVSTTPKPR